MPRSHGTRIIGLSLALLAIALVASPFALGQSQKVWTGTGDFRSGTLVYTNVSVTGSLVLATQPGNWTKFSGNPVLSPAQTWDSSSTLEPDVLYEAGIYKMWYAGCSSTCQIGYATSADGISWTPFAGNPVLFANSSSWDTSVTYPRVIHDGATYRMWYSGNGPNGIRIGYASSADGIHWTKYGTTPVFSGTMTWDQGSVNTAAVVQTGTTFVMYFSGQSTGNPGLSVGRATSTDGISWTEYSGNPVMVPQAAWEGNRIYVSWASYGSSGYDLYYYAGTVGATVYIGHAFSADGIAWTRDPGNPILSPGTAGSWDGSTVAHPCVLLLGSEARLYFTGYNQSYMQVGFATRSAQGTSFVAEGAWLSPVFDSGGPNTTWSTLSWTATTPAGTGTGASLQVGNTSVPDASWTLSQPSLSSPTTLHLPQTRYARVIVALATNNASQTPAVTSIALAYETSTTSRAGAEFWGLGLLGFVLLLALVAGVAVALGVVALMARRGRPAAPTPPQAHTALPCARCGTLVPAGNLFCGRCGAPVGPPKT